MGALSLTANSTIALPGTTADLTFNSATWTAGTLRIEHWTGSTGGGTSDKVFITGQSASAQFLANVQFVRPDNTLFPLGATFVGLTDQLVPVPEPTHIALGIFGLGFVGAGAYRRFFAKKAEAAPTVS
jgi:hypothetical protein